MAELCTSKGREAVSIFGKLRLIFSKADIDVGHVTKLLRSQNSKNDRFLQVFSFLNQVFRFRVLTLFLFFKRDQFSFERDHGFNVDESRTIFLDVHFLAKDVRLADHCIFLIRKICLRVLSAASRLVKELCGGFYDSVDVLFASQVFRQIEVESEEVVDLVSVFIFSQLFIVKSSLEFAFLLNLISFLMLLGSLFLSLRHGLQIAKSLHVEATLQEVLQAFELVVLRDVVLLSP